jgi:hypothetical protein
MELLKMVLLVLFVLSLFSFEFIIFAGLRKITKEEKDMKKILVWSFLGILFTIGILIYLLFLQLETIIGGLS